MAYSFCVACQLNSVSIPLSVWSWGWGVHGQLGLQSVEEKLLPTHAALLDDWNVSAISAGYGHSAVLTSDVRKAIFHN